MLDRAWLFPEALLGPRDMRVLLDISRVATSGRKVDPLVSLPLELGGRETWVDPFETRFGRIVSGRTPSESGVVLEVGCLRTFPGEMEAEGESSASLSTKVSSSVARIFAIPQYWKLEFNVCVC